MAVITDVQAMLEQISKAVRDNDFETAIPLTVHVVSELKEQSLREVRRIVDSVKKEDFLYVLRALDAGLMDRYSQVLVRYRNKRNPSNLSRILYSYELMVKRKYMQAEELLQQVMSEEGQAFTPREWRSAYTSAVNVLIDMRRFKEAELYLRKLDELAEEPVYDLWGYYYLCLGDWEKAEFYSTKGIQEGKRPQHSYLALQSIFTAKGNMQEALDIINRGIEHVPHYLPLYLERAKKLKNLNRVTEFLETMNQIDQFSPHHVYQRAFNYSRGVILYQSSQFEEFQAFVTNQKAVFKGTPYAECTSYSVDLITKLPTRTKLQKYNYCVPATVEMLLDRYDVSKTQDEIAKHIYHINGSSLQSTTTYLDSIGMAYQHFFGSIDVFKQLTDDNVSVILDVSYPNSSHVQLLVGYDENLQAFYIQDPSIAETFMIGYQQFEKEYCHNQIHAIAVVPKGEASKLAILPTEEHEVVEQMLHYMEALDRPNDELKKKFYEFVEQHQHYLYINATAVRMLHLEEEEHLLTACVQAIQSQHEEVDYFHLVAAHSYVRVKKYDEARALLEKVKHKRTSFYHYILGRASYENDEFLSGIHHFREAINLEPDHYDTWSYLALCHHYSEEREVALTYSEASLDINHHDYWNRMNHAFFLFENDRILDARQTYTDIIRDFKKDAHPWFERARCDRALDKPKRAIRGLKVAKKLLPEVSYPYLEMADILAYTYKNTLEAVAGLKSGLKKVKAGSSLYTKIGEIYEVDGNFNKAKKNYEEARTHYPEDSTLFLSLVKVMEQLEQTEEGVTLLKNQGSQFIEDCEFLINGGEWLFNSSEQEEDKLLALKWVENGLQLADQNMSEAWDLYVRLIEDTPFNERGREFLQSLLEERYKENVDLICYIGCLYEKDGEIEIAIEHYQRALSIKEDSFPLYRLGEVELNRGNFNEAKDYYNAILKLDNTFATVYLRLAAIADEEQNRGEEQYNLFKLLKIRPLDVNMTHFSTLSFELGKLPEVMEYLHSIQGQVEEPWRLYALSHCARAEGKLAQQENYLNQALDLESDNAAILESYAALKLQQKQYEESLSVVLHLLERNVEDRDLYGYLVDYFIETGALKKNLCISIIQQLNLQPSEKSFVYMYTAYELEQRLLHLQAVETTWLQSFTHRKEMKPYERNVIQLYKMSYSTDASNVKSMIWLFEYYNSQDKVDTTIKQATKILQEEWSFDLGLYLANCLIDVYFHLLDISRQDSLRVAEEYLQRCLKEQPNHAYIHHLIGRVYVGLEELEKANHWIGCAIEINPAEREFHYGMSVVQERLGNLTLAEKHARTCIGLEPQNLFGYNQLAHILDEQGKTKESVTIMDEMLSIDDQYVLAHYNKACYLSILGGEHLEEAQAHLTLAFELDTDGYYKKLAKKDPDLENLRKHGDGSPAS
ncbi:hypothetical protein FZW96_07605 [Bacillus sp. BGMRC 2118]|nr:hypothetical protein FZW96_07605 [Bacillus sp. BGMRC 2118]